MGRRVGELVRPTVTVESHTRTYEAPATRRDGRDMVGAVRTMLLAWAWPSETAYFHKVMTERAECNLQLLGTPVWGTL